MVGGGPSGLMAAQLAAFAGADVLLVERQTRAGGRLGVQVQPLQGPRSMYKSYNGVEFCRRLLDSVVSAEVEVMLGTSVADLNLLSDGGGFELTYTTVPFRDGKLRARAVVLATGSEEAWVDFPGSTLPGVMLLGDVQAMVNIEQQQPGKRAFIVGSDNASLLVAADLRSAGVEVVAVVDESPSVLGRETNVSALRDAGVPILTSYKTKAAHGNNGVESVTTARVDYMGTVISGTERSFDVDLICLGGPRIPQSQLATLVRCPSCEMAVMGGLVPVHDFQMATPVPGLYVCGDGAGVENGAVSLESGRLAGLQAARALDYLHPQAKAQEILARARLGYLRRGLRGQLRSQAKRILSREFRRLGLAPKAC